MMTSRLFRHLLAASLVAGTIACAAAPRVRPVKMGPVDTGPMTLTAARQYLEGRWTLESFEVFPPGRPPVTVKGDGTLLYDDYGNLKMDIRTDAATAERLTAAGINIAGGVISSEGRTVIDLQNKTLTYVLEGQPAGGFTRGGPLAANRPRHWQVDGTLLTLTTRGDDGKPLSVGRWRKSS